MKGHEVVARGDAGAVVPSRYLVDPAWCAMRCCDGGGVPLQARTGCCAARLTTEVIDETMLPYFKHLVAVGVAMSACVVVQARLTAPCALHVVAETAPSHTKWPVCRLTTG